MTYITEQYGQPTSIMEGTLSDYHAMQLMLESVGVQTRLISCRGDQATWQIRNPYSEWCKLFSGHTGGYITERCKKEIKDGAWCR